MRTRTLALVLALGAVQMTSACNECFDNGQDIQCPGGDGTPVDAVTYWPVALSAAGEHYVALIDYFNNLEEGDEKNEQWLVDLDRSGSVLTITETDLMSWAPSIAADGHGSTLVVERNGATFLRDGLVVAETTFEGEATAAYENGVYWVAVASKSPWGPETQRQLLRFDPNGVQLSKTTFPDDPGAEDSSLATDPLGDTIAAGWRLTQTSSTVVARVRQNVTTEFELAADPSLASQQPWVSPVAVRDGVVAVLFGADDVGSIVLLTATDEIIRKPVAFPANCRIPRSFIGTPGGYLLHCWGNFLLFDATGTMVSDSPAPFTARLANRRGAALVIGAEESYRIETRVVSDMIGHPTVVFEGMSREVDGGCSTTRPSMSWLVVLALLFGRRTKAFKRSRRRVHA